MECLFQSEGRGRPVWGDATLGRHLALRWGGFQRDGQTMPAQLLMHLSHVCVHVRKTITPLSSTVVLSPSGILKLWSRAVFFIIGQRPLRSLQGHLGIHTFQEDFVFVVFIYLLIFGCTGFCCWVQAFSRCSKLSLLLVVACRLLTAVASLVLWSMGSRAQVQ